MHLFVKSANFHQNCKFSSKMKIFVKSAIVCEKSKVLSKNQKKISNMAIFVNNRNLCRKIKNFVINANFRQKCIFCETSKLLFKIEFFFAKIFWKIENVPIFSVNINSNHIFVFEFLSMFFCRSGLRWYFSMLVQNSSFFFFRFVSFRSKFSNNRTFRRSFSSEFGFFFFSILIRLKIRNRLWRRFFMLGFFTVQDSGQGLTFFR